MTSQEIIDRNKEICLMLGLKPLNKPYLGAFTTNNNTHNSSFYVDRMENESWYVYPEFHFNWNWLMEAVKFIDSIEVKNSEYNSTYNVASDQFGVSIETTGYHSKTVIKVENSNRLEAMFIAVSDFAKLFNNNKL